MKIRFHCIMTRTGRHDADVALEQLIVDGLPSCCGRLMVPVDQNEWGRIAKAVFDADRILRDADIPGLRDLCADNKRLHEQLGRAAISFEQCDSDRRSFADHCTRLRIALENYGKMENWRVTPPDAASQQHLQWAGMTDPIADAVHLLRSLDAAVQEDA